MKKLIGAVFALTLGANAAFAQDAPPPAQPPVIVQPQAVDVALPDPAALPSAQYDAALPVVVVVDKHNHMTHALQLHRTTSGDQLVDVLAIPNAVGKPSTPTPNGRGVVTEKRLDPVWTPPASIDPKRRQIAPYSKTHKNPLGVAFIATSRGQIGLHGTNAPLQIGKSVSHGCVRHKNEDILKLYAMVEPGTAVYFTNSFPGTKLRASDFRVH